MAFAGLTGAWNSVKSVGTYDMVGDMGLDKCSTSAKESKTAPGMSHKKDGITKE